MAITLKAPHDAAVGAHVVKALIKHPMETGLRKDPKTGAVIPAHFIQEVVCELNGKPVFTANFGPSVSQNPMIFFQLRNAKSGDKLTLRWQDNKGESETSAPLVIS